MNMTDIYKLISLIKDARNDLKMLQDLKSKKLAELESLKQTPTRRNIVLSEEIGDSITLLRMVINLQWNTVQHLQSEIDDFNNKEE